MQHPMYDGLSEDPMVDRVTRRYSRRIDAVSEALVRKAEKLAEHFVTERARLHAKALEEATASPDGRMSVSTWCSSLKLSVRLHRGVLVIEWARKTFGAFGQTETTTYVQRNGAGDYSLKFLRDRAKNYEIELVERTETEAAILRARWRAFATIRQGVRELQASVRSPEHRYHSPKCSS